jgi:RNA polymerase sigma factor (sigma-70 family)
VIPFQRFLDEQREPVFRFLVASVGREAAEDCFQETFLAAMKAWPGLRSGSDHRAWVMTIAYRKAMDHHRARARRPVPVAAVPEVAVRDAPPADDDDDGTWARVRALPPKMRAAVTLRYAGDLSHAEVARALGCSEEAARRSAHEGLKRLREEMSAT